MKSPIFLIIVFLIAASAIFIRCSNEEANAPDNSVIDTLSMEYFQSIDSLKLYTLTFSHSMKGWELYSWPYENNWKYSILIGTNRTKTLEEVTTNRIVVIGKDSLKMVLDKIPENEYLTWKGPDWLNRCWSYDHGTLSLPDTATINEIKNYCTQKKLIFHVSD